MKKLFLLTLLGSISLFGLQNPKTLSEYKDQEVEAFLSGQLEQTQIYCPAGATLPFDLSISGDILACTLQEPLPVRTLIDCYIRCVGPGTFLFSTNGATWKTFSEAFGGKISLSVIPKEGELMGRIEAEIKLR